MAEIERIPPQNTDAERAVLGAMMLETDAAFKGVEQLNSEYFYVESHRKIFEVMRQLIDTDRPVDIITVAEVLDNRSELEKIGGYSYLSSLLSSVATAGNLEYYATIVREKGLLRQLIRIAGEISNKAYDEQNLVDEVIDSAEQRIFDISEKRLSGDFENVGDVLPETYERLEIIRKEKHRVTGIRTGYNELDDLTSGLHPSDYIIIAARPSVGKTALALSIALNVAIKEEKGVAIFSLEMAKEQLVMRLMASRFRVDAHKLRTGMLPQSDFNKIGNNLNTLSKAPIFLDDSPSLTVLDMRAKARRLMRRNPIGLILIDYLQLITTGQRNVESRQQEITTISRQIKALGRELRVPVIALSQLSRQVESRDDKRPMLADLRESGSIEQDADVVMFIYRPEVYRKKIIEIGDNKYPSEGIAELIIAKQRNGPVGSTYLEFHKEYVSFEPLSLDKREPIDSDEGETEHENFEKGRKKFAPS